MFKKLVLIAFSLSLSLSQKTYGDCLLLKQGAEVPQCPSWPPLISLTNDYKTCKEFIGTRTWEPTCKKGKKTYDDSCNKWVCI